MIFVTIMGGSQTITNPADPSDYTTLATVLLPGMLAYGFFASGFQNLAMAVSQEREKGSLSNVPGWPGAGWQAGLRSRLV